jgi:hypothetical protein
MNLLPLIDRIRLANQGVVGKSLFLQMLPAECSQGVLLRTPLTGTKINHELPGYFRGEFQLIVRQSGYDETLIKAIIETLTFERAWASTQFFMFCRPRTLPVAYPLSKGNLVEHSVMFDCVFSE